VFRLLVSRIRDHGSLAETHAATGHTGALREDLQRLREAVDNLDLLVEERLPSALLLTEPDWSSLGGQPVVLDGAPEAAAQLAPLRGTVLVVDDSPTSLEILTRQLSALGLSPSKAGSGEEALAILRHTAFDIVILDVVMPGLGGLATLSRLKALPATSHLPVIMISSLDDMDSIVRCLEEGAEDFITKPFSPALLRARLAGCLRAKHLADSQRTHLAQLEDSRDRLDSELAEAARYIRSILPPPITTPVAIDWRYQPCTELGGDAFGYHPLDDDHLAIYLLDVCGHGVAASLLSVTAINVIRSGSLPATDFLDPSSVLASLNRAFPMERQNNMYFTIWYGVLHHPSGTLRHASAGHPPALLATPQGIERVHAPGLITGMLPDSDYVGGTTHLPPHSRLFVFSDGCFESRQENGSRMPFEEFESFLATHGHDDDVLDHLHRRVSGSGKADDDFSIMRVTTLDKTLANHHPPRKD
jgi:phosphoserine phosphatase RsbU/P